MVVLGDCVGFSLEVYAMALFAVVRLWKANLFGEYQKAVEFSAELAALNSVITHIAFQAQTRLDLNSKDQSIFVLPIAPLVVRVANYTQRVRVYG
jgi:hypothetical protein